MADALPQATFSYSKVRAILARLHNINESKLMKFEARLQQLQKLGLPRGTNAGRAGRARYAYWQLAELDVYLCFLDAGATPALLSAHFTRRPFYATVYGQYVEDAPPAEEQYVGMRFRALEYLRSADADRHKASVFDHEIYGGPGLKFFAGLGDQPSIVVNLTRRVAALKKVAGDLFPLSAGQPVFPGQPGSLSDG